MTTYAAILSGPAAVLKPGVNPRTFRTPEDEDGSVFNYTETASDRVGIGALTERLSAEKVAFIGLGGTGSYALDLVAKTPVREIRLFDGDEFLQHNAFRTPGAPSITELREAPKKVDYLKGIYSNMHRGIVVHAAPIDATNLHLLDGITFAFVCMDAGEPNVSLSETGGPRHRLCRCWHGARIGRRLIGRNSARHRHTPQKRDHVHQGRISFVGGGDDLYSSNIQVADLNALNAVLAVVKWKKLRGFYRDLEQAPQHLYDGRQHAA